MTSVTLNWPLIGSVVAALAGIAGTILTPIYGTGLAGEIQGLLQGLSALLIAIPTFHMTSTAAYNAKLRGAARYQRAA